MALKNLFLFYFIFYLVWGADCPQNHIEIDEECYLKSHIDVLQDFIDLNNSLNSINPLNLGYQEWTNNRLTHLYLGELQISTIPDSIGLLKDLNHLDLRKNNVISIPEGICDIYPYYSHVNLSENKICHPYPFCYDYIGNQNTEECEAFKCPSEYIDIEGECYNEEHIDVLQAIIDSNSILSSATPLDLGQNIGLQQWENGQLTHLNLVSNGLTTLPKNLCSIYKNLQLFDVSNNLICPPYPPCFEYIGYQNTENCNSPEIENNVEDMNLIDNSEISTFITDINVENFQSDLAVLQSFIDKNESLTALHPFEIGRQEWKNMRLISLDLSSLGLTHIPSNICTIYSDLSQLDLSNNSICPPYPDCIEYVEFQNKDHCGGHSCPDEFEEINGECYFKEHLNILQEFINNNPALSGNAPAELGATGGMNNWIGGRLNQLVLVGDSLTNIPESICNIYSELSVFDVTHNYICQPYPTCIENVGYQNIDACFHTSSCPDGYLLFDEQCYNFIDLQVLIDFTNQNENIQAYHPLLLGRQVWKDNRLNKLILNGLNITQIPESIDNLEFLEYLNISNNKLEQLPETLCNIYPQLKGLEINNNLLCPPYMDCFDFVGKQNTENCEKSFCPYGYLDMEGECYFEKDVSTLKDFINMNESLKDRNPLDIGIQKWKNMHLDYLYLGVNELTVVPESVCDILPGLKIFNISQNKICPPYPNCVEDYIGEQDASGCP